MAFKSIASRAGTNSNGAYGTITSVPSGSVRSMPTHYSTNKAPSSGAQTIIGTKGGSSSSGSGGGYSSGGSSTYAQEPAFDQAAYMAQLMAQQQAALETYKTEQTAAFDAYTKNQLSLYDKAYQDQLNAAQSSYDQNSSLLRQGTDAANTQVDKNSAASIDAARLTTEEALRQANILRQQAERTLPSASLMAGGGGMSESAMMDVYNTYNQSRDETNTGFSNTQKEVLNQADNLKASNEQSYTQNIANLRDQLAQQQANYANTKTQAQMALEKEKANFELQLVQMIAQNNLTALPQYAQYAYSL